MNRRWRLQILTLCLTMFSLLSFTACQPAMMTPPPKKADYEQGYALFQQGRFAEAKPYFQQALAHPSSRQDQRYIAHLQMKLGFIYRLEGQNQAAIDAFNKVIAISGTSVPLTDSEYVQANLYLADLYQKQGDSTQAKQLLANQLAVLKALPASV